MRLVAFSNGGGKVAVVIFFVSGVRFRHCRNRDVLRGAPAALHHLLQSLSGDPATEGVQCAVVVSAELAVDFAELPAVDPVLRGAAPGPQPVAAE